VTGELRAIIDGMRSGPGLTRVFYWLALAEALSETGY
jgi:hypothetical protein